MFNMMIPQLAGGPSLADIAAVTNNGNRDGDGYGFGGGLWALVLIALLFGRMGFFGNGGLFGGNGGFGVGSCCAPATCADLQRGFDNQTVVTKLNGLENGLCSLGYDQLAQINGINTNVTQVGNGLMQAINNMGVANMQDTNALSRQLSDCCCEEREAITQLRYNSAQDTCAINNNINNAVRDIVENANANYRAIDGRITALEMSHKDEIIAELRSQVNALNLGISQRNQNDYLVNTLRPCPNPAYIVDNPYCCNSNNNCGRCC